ncbi:MAG TPA: hypothetical protein VKI64_05240 [Acidimicrobiales bacterium]|nr:hypothetical protein [Acidimicrobiales bacterium]
MEQGQDLPSNQSAPGLDRARREVGLTQEELWGRYFALGGMAMPDEFEAYLEGVLTPGAHEHDVLVHALNERSMELGSPQRWAYSDDE